MPELTTTSGSVATLGSTPLSTPRPAAGAPSSGAYRRPPVRTLKTVVIRVGAPCAQDAGRLGELVERVRAAWAAGERVVLVHAPDDRRDPEDLLETTRTLVERLIAAGVTARGLSGIDLGLVAGTTGRAPGARLDAVALRRVLEGGAAAVVAPLSQAPDGRATPTCPDALAHAAAAALGADALELLGDAPTPSRSIPRARVEALLERSDLGGDLRGRLVAARAALLHGVRDVRLDAVEAVDLQA